VPWFYLFGLWKMVFEMITNVYLLPTDNKRSQENFAKINEIVIIIFIFFKKVANTITNNKKVI